MLGSWSNQGSLLWRGGWSMPITSELPPPALPLENLLKGSISSRALKGLGRHRQLYQSHSLCLFLKVGTIVWSHSTIGENFLFKYIFLKCGVLHLVLYLKNSDIFENCVMCSVTQSCLTVCDPIDYSPLGSFVHGIFHIRILEQVAISSSKGFSQPKDWTSISCVSCLGRWILYHCLSQPTNGYNFDFI